MGPSWVCHDTPKLHNSTFLKSVVFPGQIPMQQNLYGRPIGKGLEMNPSMIHPGLVYGAGMGSFTSFIPSPVPPAWLQQPLPPVYQTALRSCIAPGSPAGYPDTVMVYQVLMQSGLPRETLGHIWSLANRTLPGQLTPTEFFIALALVGYVQVKKRMKDDIPDLTDKHCSCLAAPRLSTID